ncbi:MAG: hypothetical protein J6V55_06660 [Alistipes sp.]|nr:hypothetical protein [Alistipes sp.]
MIKEKSLYYYKKYEIKEANFMPISKKHTGLSVDIMVDNDATYEYMEHPVWIYFRNGYDDICDDWIPMIVSKNPYLPYPNKRVNISNDDFYKVLEFVYEYRIVIKALANIKISTRDFIYIIKRQQENLNEGVILGNRHLNEMSVLQTKNSGLPLKLWIDDGGSWMKSKHNERLKVENPYGEKNTRKWMSIILADGEPRVEFPEKLDSQCKRHIKEVLKFVKKYKEMILKITRKEARMEDLIDKIEDDVSNNNDFLQYEIVRDAKFGYTIVKNDENLYNYVNEDGKLLSDKWFDVAGVFQQRKNNEVSAYVEIDNEVFYLTIEGKLID